MKELLQNLTTIQSNDPEKQRRGSIAISMCLIILLANISLLLVAIAFIDWAWIINIGICVIALSLALYLARAGSVTIAGLLLILVIAVNATAPLITGDSYVFATAFFLSLGIIASSLILPIKYILFTFSLNTSLILYILYQFNQSVFQEHDWGDVLVAALACNLMAALLAFLNATVLNGFFRRVVLVKTEVQHHSTLLEQQNSALEQRIIERTEELKIALQQVEQRGQEHAQLLADNERQRSIIRQMHTPIIPVSDHTLIAPLVGEVDVRHFDQFSALALQAIIKNRARYLIIDMSGVPFINDKNSELFIQIVSAAKLLGTEILLVGMRPDVAHSAVHFGLNTKIARTYLSLEIALKELDIAKQQDTITSLADRNTTPSLAAQVEL